MSTILEAIEGEVEMLRAMRARTEARARGYDPDSCMHQWSEGVADGQSNGIQALERLAKLVSREEAQAVGARVVLREVMGERSSEDDLRAMIGA